MFIVFEGLDKSGKSTTCQNVYNKLKEGNNSIFKICFPDRTTKIGEMIDKYLKNKIRLSPESSHLLFTADRYDKKKYIEEVRKHNILLCDRYSWSGITYSNAKGLDLAWCIDSERLLPKPDITFYLQADPKILMTRKNWGEEVLEVKEFQEKVAEAYSHMSDFVENVIKVDATKPADKITDFVINEIYKYKMMQEQHIVN